MQEYYTSFNCKRCNKDTILITEELENTLKNGGYVVCSHCSCKNVIQSKRTDNLRECMNERKYKKVHGAIRQR